MSSKTKSILIAVGAVVVVVLVLGGIKASQIGAMIAAGEAFVPPAQAVTTAEVQQVEWKPQLRAVGSLIAVQGVMLSTEVPGIVRQLNFESGETVEEGLS